MFNLFIELCELYCESFSWDGEPKKTRDEDVILNTILLWLLSFSFGCCIGLVYCEYFAGLSEEIRPLSNFFLKLTEELSVPNTKSVS